MLATKSYRRSTFNESFDPERDLKEENPSTQVQEGRKFAVMHDSIVEGVLAGTEALKMFETVVGYAVVFSLLSRDTPYQTRRL